MYVGREALEKKVGGNLIELTVEESMLEIFIYFLLTELALSNSSLGHLQKSLLGWK